MSALLRLLAYVLVVGLLVAASVWLADRPGAVTVIWEGWRVDTSVPVLLLALALLVAVLFLALRLGTGLARLPGGLVRSWRERQRRKGYLALGDGLAALTSGDGKAAQRLARRANSLLGGDGVTAVLSAKAAGLSGDVAAAQGHYTRLLERRETQFAGLKGLLELALAQGDRAAALDAAQRAYNLRPDAEGLAGILGDLEAQAGHWEAAAEIAARAHRKGWLEPAEAAHKQAVALVESARRARGAGDISGSLRLLAQAQRADTSFVPATLALAEALAGDNRQRKAAAVLEKGWRGAPHPQIASAYLALWPTASALERVKRIERLVRGQADHNESHLALARVALLAGLWGQSRKHLDLLIARQPSAVAFGLYAELEEKERHDAAVARDWRLRASSLPPPPVWRCDACGAASAEWHGSCPSCGDFDRINWG